MWEWTPRAPQRLTAAAYGDGQQAGRLLIRWQASDTYLDPRPVTLKFAEDPAGPWTVIASALPNTGEFAWPADAQVPAAVYLQLEVRDEAGNITIDQLSDPVRIEGLAPKARIRGIQPIQDADREAFRQPRELTQNAHHDDDGFLRSATARETKNVGIGILPVPWC